MFKGLLTACLVLSLMITLLGCEKSKDEAHGESSERISASAPEEVVAEEVFEADIIPLQDAMLAAASDLPEMYTVNSDDEDGEYCFSYLCDIEYSKVAGYFLSYASTPTAEEIAVIALKDPSDSDMVIESLNQHVEDRINLFSTYAQDEVERLNNALIFSEDNYCALIICDNAEDVRNEFYKYK